MDGYLYEKLALMAWTVDVDAKKAMARDNGDQLCIAQLNKCVDLLCPLPTASASNATSKSKATAATAAVSTPVGSKKTLSVGDEDYEDTVLLLLNTLEVESLTCSYPIYHNNNLYDMNMISNFQCMATVGEEYRARFAFQQSLPRLQHIATQMNHPQLIKAAQSAIKVITWRP